MDVPGGRRTFGRQGSKFPTCPTDIVAAAIDPSSHQTIGPKLTPRVIKVMPEFVETSTAQAVVGVLVLCVLTVAGLKVVSIFRDYADDDQEIAGDVLANLKEMRLKGDISDEEFRTIEARTHRPPVGPSAIDDSTSSDDSSPDPQT